MIPAWSWGILRWCKDLTLLDVVECIRIPYETIVFGRGVIVCIGLHPVVEIVQGGRLISLAWLRGVGGIGGIGGIGRIRGVHSGCECRCEKDKTGLGRISST